MPSQRRERRGRRGRNNVSYASVTQITYDAPLSSYLPDNEMHPLERRREVMTWRSDSTSVLLYAILATLFVVAWIYVPA
jgi:hypothetical protein